jgi:hypothetical protein
MKYLERYSVIHSLLEHSSNLSEDDFTELKEFCDNSLAYLLDDGYEIKLTRDRIQTGYNYYEDGYMVVTLHFPGDNYNTNDSYATTKEFHWNDVKDYYIPFLQLLSRRYKLGTLQNKTKHGDIFFSADRILNRFIPSTYCKLEQVINDEIDVDVIWGIDVKVISKI